MYEVSSYPISQSQSGKGTSVVNQYKDVTNSRQLYAKLLQNEKMGAIGLLAGNIAHELNNPLTGIRSLSQILISQTADQPQLNSDLKEIEKASARSQQIIRNLLEFSSGTTNTSRLITMEEIFEKTQPMLKTITRNLRTDIQLATQGAQVLVEPQLIQQVIFNLIQNASQALEGRKQPGMLTIRSTLMSDGFVEFSIRDNGPGIPKEMQQKIFEPFFTTKAEGQGTGLGLSLSRDIMKRFGGDLLLKSESEDGAHFILRLPIAVAETKK
jgi:signal transduction histidine kinase